LQRSPPPGTTNLEYFRVFPVQQEFAPMRHWPFLGLALAVCLAPVVVPADPPKPATAPADPWRGPYPDDPDLPEGFADTVVATGITGATALAIAPDGRLFVCEQTGALRVVKKDQLLAEPFVTVTVDSYWERGLIGVTLDPDFPKSPYVYLCYVAPKPYPHHRVSRFTARGDVAVPGSEVVLLDGDDQTKLGGAQPAGHQGGAIHFGKDGKLYVAIGEQTAGTPAQRLDTFQGKLLRINRDGSIPDDNPFAKTAKGKYRAIWALGLRNPFAFAVQPGTGRLFINDVGNARIEEINEGAAGANYGWPEAEGPTTNPKYKNPLYAYDHNVGRSITGGTFYNPPARQFPERYAGKYFFLDFMDHWMRVLDPDNPKDVEVFATGLAGPVDVVTAPDGSLYYLNRKEWVKDDKFQKQTGSLHRIRYVAGSDKPLPNVTEQPADVTAALGHKAELRLSANGGPPLRYRWFRNGVPISGAEGPRCELPAVTAADDGAQFRCFVSNSFGSTKSRRATLHVLPLREGAPTGPLVQGLGFRCYEGRWASLPDFEALKPAKAGTVANVDLTPRSRDEDVGMTFRGFVGVETEGVYAFDLTANGPARLFVGGAEVAAVYGKGERESSGHVALKAGKHPFVLLFAHREGKPRLQVHWSGPGLAKQAIPNSSFFRPDNSALTAPAIRPDGVLFTGPIRVCLSVPTEGAVIRYTLDGKEPTAESTLYQQPFRLSQTATVQAKAFKGDKASSVSRATYQISGASLYGLPYREPVTTLNVPPRPEELPALLSQTGVFRSLADLAPNPGIVPYDVNAPLWSDGAAKRRWLALPGDARIDFSPKGEWKFPAGTVFVKHFELATGPNQPDKARRLETRVLVVDGRGGGYGATYKWRDDQGEADLLADGMTEEIAVQSADGPAKMKWAYPSRGECLMCHTANAGFVLGVKTRQMNRAFTYPATGLSDNQLRTLNHLGLFRPALDEADLSRLDRLAALTDAGASLEQRVRSYLDANCAQCHRPGGARGLFDARYDTPLARQNLVNGPVAAADLGVADAKLIMPGDTARSIIHERMNRRRDVYDMPPLATNRVDKEAVAVLEEWIKGLKK
jgi:uncharacterized repeat protein (TIGR03806 family)